MPIYIIQVERYGKALWSRACGALRQVVEKPVQCYSRGLLGNQVID